MARTYEEVLQDALALTEEERGDLIDALEDSGLTEEERQAKAEWHAELARRVAEIEAGTAVLIPAEDVIRELRAKYEAHRRTS